MYRTPILVALAAASGAALVVLAAVFLPGPHPTDAGSPALFVESITIEPSAPTRLEAVSITLAGEAPTSCPVTTAHTRSGNDIYVTILHGPGHCSLVFVSFNVTEQLGLLPAGTYQVLICEITEPHWLNKFCSAPESFELLETTLEVTFIAVGGIAELPPLERAALEADSSEVSAGVLASIVAAVAAGILAVGGAAWHARRRLTG